MVSFEVVEMAFSGEGVAPQVRTVGTVAFDDVEAKESTAVDVKVGFTLRSEGVLKVEAVDVGSGATRELVIGHDGVGSS